MPIPIVTALLGAGAGGPVADPGPRTRLTLERVARFPPPGARVPGEFRFTHDGRFLYYLHDQGPDTPRVLYREEVGTGVRRVVASPPRESDGPLPREEILRRERLRIQDKGITQYVVADRADVVVFSYAGNLHLVQPGREPRRLTHTSAAEIDPKLSPDGRRLAFARENDLWVIELDTGEERRLTRGGRDGVTHGVAEYIAQEEMGRPTGFWWSPDGGRLAFTEVDETGVPLYPIVHQGQGTREVEEHRYPFAGEANAKVRLAVIEAAGTDPAWLQLAPDSEDIYLARALWEPAGSLLVTVQTRDQKGLRLLRFDRDTLRPSLVLEERSSTYVTLHDDLKALRDGRFLWSSESTGYRHLELRAADGALIRRLTSGDWAVDDLEGVDEAEEFVYFTAAKDGPLQRLLYRAPLAGGEIERLTPERGFHAVILSENGRWFVDVADDVRTPPRVTLRDRAGRVVRTIEANDDPEVAALGLRPPEFVTIEGDDGTALHGAIYKPRGFNARVRYPAIVRVYGGPGAQTVKDSWELTQDLRAQYLTEQGYVVFRLDNRGSARRGVAFETAIHLKMGRAEVEDQAAGARYLARLPYIDGSRIGIYGWSYGGYMAALCLLDRPDLFRAAVVGAPVTDWDGYDTHYTERYMGAPQDNPEGYRLASVLSKAAGLKGRLLIIHGMTDENVHFRHTARLLGALNAAQKTYDLLIFPEERHLPRGEADRRFMEQRIVEHFDRSLKQP